MTRSTFARGLAIGGLCVAMLVGCSTGSAPEAERAREDDAERTSVITDMQATYTWELINSTPSATLTETPAP